MLEGGAVSEEELERRDDVTLLAEERQYGAYLGIEQDLRRRCSSTMHHCGTANRVRKEERNVVAAKREEEETHAE
jgi:hypothetical protein